jgi:hypothetical protein
MRFVLRYRLELALAAVVILFFSDYLFSANLLYGSDSIPSALFYRGYLVEFVKAHGELPKWNPYILGGLPFIDATHGDTFFPTSIIQYFVPVYRALGDKLVIHVFLAGVFMAFYLRTLRLGAGAVALGSLGYMLSPVFVSYIYAGQDGKMYVCSLAPLVLGLLERAMSDGRLRTFVLLGLSIGVMILSAQIQMAYHCLWFAGALFLLRLWRPRDPEPAGAPPRAKVRRAGLFVVAVGLGVMIASIQLFPAVAYVKHPAGFSVRSERTSYEHAASWSLHPEEAVGLVIPEFANAPDGYWGRNFFKYNSDYLGAGLLLLAALALARRRDATRMYLGGVAVFCVLYSMGEHTPLHRLFYWVVPQVKLFRAPPLVMFGAAFGVAALAACAVQDLTEFRKKDATRWAARLLPIGLVAAGVVLLLGLGASGFTNAWVDVFRPPMDATKRAILEANLPAFRNGALVVAGILAATTGLVVAWLRGAAPSRLALGGLLLLTLVDFWRIDTRFKMVLPPERWTEPRGVVADLARESRTEKFRVMPATRELAFNGLGTFRIESALGFHDNELAWYRELRDDPAAEGLLAVNEAGYPLLRMLNVRCIVHDSPDFPNPLPIQDPVPRFRVVGNWEVVPSREEIVPRLLDVSHDPTRSVLLEEDPGVPSLPADAPLPGRVVESRYDGNEIHVTVEADAPCLLVHAENWFPYWHAMDGDRELPILRADGTLRAIPLAPGRHDLTFVFRSRPYEAGKWVTGLAMLLVALGVALDRKRSAGPTS